MVAVSFGDVFEEALFQEFFGFGGWGRCEKLNRWGMDLWSFFLGLMFLL